MIALTGGIVYGIPDSASSTTEHVCKPRRVDVIIAAGKVLTLMEPSKTASFINSIRSYGLKILQIPVQDQVIMPGLIDVHVHAIGGGGEQGLFC
jgi:imidazolonepropionase-like amidohydrolase